MLKIKTIAEPLSEEQVMEMLINTDKTINIQKIDRLYYPYMNMIYSVKLKGSLAKLDRLMLCSIDMVYGRPAIGQGRPNLVEIEIDDVMAIDPLMKEEDLDRIGHDFIMKMFISKVKILATPTIKLDDMTFFHKLYYIVHCKDLNDQDYFIMADSMDGSISILDF